MIHLMHIAKLALDLPSGKTHRTASAECKINSHAGVIKVGSWAVGQVCAAIKEKCSQLREKSDGHFGNDESTRQACKEMRDMTKLSV